MVSPAQIEGVLFFTLNSGLKTDFPRYFGASWAFPPKDLPTEVKEKWTNLSTSLCHRHYILCRPTRMRREDKRGEALDGAAPLRPITTDIKTKEE